MGVSCISKPGSQMRNVSGYPSLEGTITRRSSRGGGIGNALPSPAVRQARPEQGVLHCRTRPNTFQNVASDVIVILAARASP